MAYMILYMKSQEFQPFYPCYKCEFNYLKNNNQHHHHHTINITNKQPTNARSKYLGMRQPNRWECVILQQNYT